MLIYRNRSFSGVQFICFNVDYRVLFQEVTEEAVTDGFQFYATFFNAPPAIKALLHGMIGVAFLALLAKIHAWDESAMFFDGSSLGASCTSPTSIAIHG